VTVHPEKIVSGGENSLEAALSCPAESGERCGKKQRWKKEPSGVRRQINMDIWEPEL
jgi:hypothetical protein